MKRVLAVIDGLGDRPITEYGGRTPLKTALTPNLDWLALEGSLGLTGPGMNFLAGLRPATLVAGVDAVRAAGRAAGLEVVEVPGATGGLDTDFEGKAEAVLAGLRLADTAILHYNAPAEASRRSDLAGKLESITSFDAFLLAPLLDELAGLGHYRFLAVSGPGLSVQDNDKKPLSEPLVFALYDRHGLYPASGRSFSEEEAADTGLTLSWDELAAVFFEE